MYIVTQSKDSVVNFDNCTGLSVDDNLVVATIASEKPVVLGVYGPRRAAEVVKWLIEHLSKDGKMYMPEE